MSVRFNRSEVMTLELHTRYARARDAAFGPRLPRDSDDLALLDPLMVEAICDGDDPYRKQARKWVIV